MDYQEAVRADPVGWVNQQYGVELWSKQAEVIEAVRDHPRVVVPSCNAAGKSFVAACTAMWYSEAVYPSYVVITGASWTGIEKVVWPWIHRLHIRARHPQGGELHQFEWKRGVQWGIFSVSATEPERFAGFRTEAGVLVIVDEASSLDRMIFDAIMGLTASEGNKVLMIGNPLRTVGPFKDAWESPLWHRVSISALETPNVVHGREIIPGLATKQWIDERRVEWGENNAEYVARVLGQFPVTGQNSFFNGAVLNDVEARDCRPCVWRGEIVQTRDSYGRLKDYRLMANPDGPLRLWVMPCGDRLPIEANYVIGCDVAAGLGASNSVASIARVRHRDEGEQVGDYVTNRESPDEFAATVDALGRVAGGQAGRAYVAWEANGDGGIMGARLLGLGYNFVYRMRDERIPTAKPARVPGWHSSAPGKRLMLGDLRGALARGQYVIRSIESIREARDYVYYPTGAVGPAGLIELPAGEQGAHGDRVIADGLTYRACREQPHARAPEPFIPPHTEAAFAKRVEAEQSQDSRWQ